jgi:energy-coupling factor transporter ATP-binding protein EcfA2
VTDVAESSAASLRAPLSGKGRSRKEEPPLLVVLLGPTGSGKSTLLNSLAQDLVSAAGVMRPTSDRLVVWSQAGSRRPEEGSLAGLKAESAAGSDVLLQRLAIVDTPDLDSDITAHRELALEAADRSEGLVFVVSPVRYADAALWSAVEGLAVTRKPILFVLNRATPDTAAATAGLSAMIEHRLRGVPDPLEVPELRPSRVILPAPIVSGLRSHLMGWGRRSNAIRRMVRAAAETNHA